jgi:transposase
MAQLARLAGVAPLDASSGQQRRHRLNPHGNRALNSALHKIAVVQGRWQPRARVYLQRRQAEGKTAAKRCAASNATPSGSCSGSCAKPALSARHSYSSCAAARFGVPALA